MDSIIIPKELNELILNPIMFDLARSNPEQKLEIAKKIASQEN
jgi:hypothetical protein